MVRRLCRLSPVVFCFLATSAPVWANDFEIVATIKSSQEQVQTKHTRNTTRRRGSNLPGKSAVRKTLRKPQKSADANKKLPPRPVFKVKADTNLSVGWRVTNVSKTANVTNLMLHYFVVMEKKVRQEKVPELGKDVVHEGLLFMDFKPTEKASGRFTLNVPQTGNYLIRVETIGLEETYGYDHYTAIDLVVE